jgi:hypothetical protein
MKRRRAWRRAAWAALALLALGALRIALGKSLGGWVAARERARFEREVGTLDPALLAGSDALEGENSVPAIRRAVAGVELAADERERLVRFERGAALSPRELERLDAWLDTHDDTLARLAAAAGLPRSSFGPRPELFHGGHLVPTSWLLASRLSAADGERALVRGQAPRVERALRTLNGLAAALRREPLPVFALLGDAVEIRYLALLQMSLRAAPTAELLATAEAQLELLGRLPGAAEVTHGEAVFGHDMLRREVPAARAPATRRERIEALLWPWSPGHVEAGYLEGWRELHALARRPQTAWAGEEIRFAARHSPLRRWLDPTVPYEAVKTILMPNLLESVRRLQLLRASEQLARLALECARRTLATGVPPADVATFPGGAMPDAATGSLPRYTVETDGVAVLELAAARTLVRTSQRAAPPAQRHLFERRARLLRWEIAPPGRGR